MFSLIFVSTVFTNYQRLHMPQNYPTIALVPDCMPKQTFLFKEAISSRCNKKILPDNCILSKEKENNEVSI